MLRRKIEKDICNWIENDKKALLVYGVRQCGKTYIIRKCLNELNKSYVEFNLLREPEVLKILESFSDVDDLILRLSLYSNIKLVPNETIIFFDEIQKYKEIVTKIKFLVDDGRFKYVLSGSLLGVEINNIKSAPVGYLKSLKMYPLDFEEFLQLFNVDDGLLSRLKDSYDQEIIVDEVIHNRLLQIFNLYLIIGGMPAAIEKYRETSDIDEVMDEHLNIIEQYKLDFTQYEEENKKLKITSVYDLIPAEINKENKRFNISDINKDLRYEKIEDSFNWLYRAGVALGVFNTTEPLIPLMINEKRSLFKVFLSDVGLLTTLYGKATKLKIMNNDSGINKGAIYENVIAQELCAHGFNLYYYNNKKLGEVDFMIENKASVLPIEVKSGKDYKRHSALKNLLRSDNYKLDKALVFSHENVYKDNKILYLPIYMIMFVDEEDIDFIDISLDKFSL